MGVPSFRFYARRPQELDIFTEAATVIEEGKFRTDQAVRLGQRNRAGMAPAAEWLSDDARSGVDCSLRAPRVWLLLSSA